MTVTDTIYRESVFKGTEFFHEEIPVSVLGEAGTPLPYTIADDSIIAIVLMFTVLVSVLMVVKSFGLICFQTKTLLSTPRENSAELRETDGEMYFQTYFVLQSVILSSILCFALLYDEVGVEYMENKYRVLGTFCLPIALYFLVREMLRLVVHGTFFNRTACHIENIHHLYFITLQGLLLLPVTILYAYANLSSLYTQYILIAAYLLPVLMHSCKVYNIYFRKKNDIFAFLLYFSALEVVPLTMLAGTADYLTKHI